MSLKRKLECTLLEKKSLTKENFWFLGFVFKKLWQIVMSSVPLGRGFQNVRYGAFPWVQLLVEYAKKLKPTIIPPPPPSLLLLLLLPLLLAVVLSASPSGPQLKTIRPSRKVLRSLFSKTRFSKPASEPFPTQSCFWRFSTVSPRHANFIVSQDFF